MDREIKFEYGFRSANGIIKKVYHLYEIPNIKDKCDIWNELPVVYVRQFTGLKDINGKEIYEGDRVIGKLETGYSYTGKVIEFDACWVLDENGKIIPLFQLPSLEIIGNIYKNNIKQIK